MDSYEQHIHDVYDRRISTLGHIKTRTLGADVLTLTALRVLVYSQLEGGVKEQTSLILRYLNAHALQIGELPACLLRWRNAGDLDRFRAAITFENITSAFPFGNLPAKRAKVRPINRLKEYNQMNAESIGTIYSGLGLNKTTIAPRLSDIDDLVGARNDAAHHGLMPSLSVTLLESHVRGDVNLVEAVLTDLALQALTYFSDRLHRR